MRSVWPRFRKMFDRLPGDRGGRADEPTGNNDDGPVIREPPSLFHMSAEGGTRTPTSFRPLAPEASASTSSTTSARGRNVIGA